VILKEEKIMKKDYTTPSMVITSFSSEAVIMASSVISADSSAQTTFTKLDIGNWNS
jgi:hypothetical protein